MVKTYCTHCTKKCVGDVLKVGDKYFHQNCFKCKDCNANLDTGGFFFRNENYYCPKDYKMRFSNKCFICSDIIESEIVSAMNHHFHRNCFKCSICCTVFSPGDRVTMKCDQFICNACLCQKISNGDDNIKSREMNGGKVANIAEDHDPIHDAITSDQGYISSDPASFSFPTPTLRDDEDKKAIDISSQFEQQTKSKSSSYRSLFEFGKFYRSSYLDIQESRVKERQFQSRTSSRTSTCKFSSDFHLPFPKNGYLKTQNNAPSSKPSGIDSAISSPLMKIASPNESDVNEKENVIRLASYPAGEKPLATIPIALERDDWPSPLSTSILISEKVHRRQKPLQSPPVIQTNDIINYTQSLNQLVYDRSTKMQRNLIDILHSPTTQTHNRKLDATVISSSRSPNASIEPLTKPRYSNHKDKSKSRDLSYINDTQRQIGYSLEFISSTSRPFMAGRAPYSTKSRCSEDVLMELKSAASRQSMTLNTSNCDKGNWTAIRSLSETYNGQTKNLEYDSTVEETLFDYQDELSSSDIDVVTGLKITKKRSFKDKIKDTNVMSDKSSINSKVESLETLSYRSQKPGQSVKNIIVPYYELMSRDPRIMKGLEITRLETYLSTEDFQKLFNLNRADFYRLPEWKRNDLKRRIHLF